MDILQRFLRNSALTGWVEVRADGVVLDANTAFAGYVRVPSRDLVGQDLFELVTPSERDRLQSWTRGDPPPGEPIRINFAAGDGTPFTLRCLVGTTAEGLGIVGEPEPGEERSTAEELMRLNNELVTMAREEVRRQRELERVRAALEAALGELQTSYWHLRKIQEALPICMECGKIRTRSGAAGWQSIVDYLRENQIFLSHGYCPVCAQAKLVEFGLE